MEERLDDVEEGKLSWRKALAEFDKTFTADRDRALEEMVSGKAGIPLGEARKLLSFPVVPLTAETCPKCGKKLKLRMGKNGLFVACSGYPELHVHAEHPRSRGGRRSTRRSSRTRRARSAARR